jgi:hypothetical protein
MRIKIEHCAFTFRDDEICFSTGEIETIEGARLLERAIGDWIDNRERELAERERYRIESAKDHRNAAIVESVFDYLKAAYPMPFAGEDGGDQ